ncbi:MAG TPA: 23S rRNA (adenine(2503)-C(2))-methyltransferase RlmN [Thermoanaerobaculia bacterium]|nr:23S rRNA (adenine(2503)-C(2))-methyltransferase RlmN [Thermoanaerobaculia bacterium]
MTTSNLYDLAPGALEAELRQTVSPPFRAKQVEEWMHVRGVDSFEAMTNVPKETRALLAERYTLELPRIVEVTPPAPDGSRKYLFELRDKQRIESVYMPMGERTSVCLSSQAGCAVGCTFCVTGFFGAGRNLMPSEMLGQFFTIVHEQGLPLDHMNVVNVVFMGMGEPLLNFENVVTTLDVLYRNIAPKRITVSTSGIIPGIEDLARLERRPNLAVSINAPDRERREEIMPITAKYPLDELIAVLRRFPLEKGRDITIEYVLLAGYNDAPRDAVLLAKLIRGLHAKVNAIPLNEDANLPGWMKRPSDSAIDRFVDTLVQHDVHVTVRRSKGRDIAAACGQLRGKSEAKSRVSRQPHLAERRVDRAGRVEAAGEKRHVVHRERR